MIIVTWENKGLFVLTEFITHVCNKWTWAVVLMLNGPIFEVTAALVKFQHCKIQQKKNCVWRLTTEQSEGAGGRIYSCTLCRWMGSSGNVCSEAPSKPVPHCCLQGCRPSSAVSHLYFSSGAAVPAQTTYFENQSQLRQNLAALVQDSDANCLFPREP